LDSYQELPLLDEYRELGRSHVKKIEDALRTLDRIPFYMLSVRLPAFITLNNMGCEIDTDFETSFSDFLDLYDPADRLPRLLPIYRKLQGELFWRAIGCTWAWCYDTWAYRRPLLMLFRRNMATSMARKYDGEAPLTVYRGCQSRRVGGVSWTTNRKIGENFAYGHSGFRTANPVIAEARIARNGVFDYDNGQDEDEVILEPRGLQILSIERLDASTLVEQPHPSCVPA
jgi:hypothetical protein